MKTILATATLSAFLVVQPAQAAEQCENITNVKVNGMVCDFCARALEKVFSKRDEVEAIKVDLDAGVVRITTKPNQTIDDASINELITDSGYDISAIEKGC